jgi:Protein of unknown function (DUF3606)
MVLPKILDSLSSNGTPDALPSWPQTTPREKNHYMRSAKRPPIRNRIDLSDPGQVRAWKRRLGLSTNDLQRVIEKVGNSITAVTKEIELERASGESTPAQASSNRPSQSVQRHELRNDLRELTPKEA